MNYSKLTNHFINLSILFSFLLYSPTVYTQSTNSSEKTNLKVTGFKDKGELKRYVKSLQKGKKLKQKSINNGTKYSEYLDLINPSAATENSMALYQFSIQNDKVDNVKAALKQGNGLLEPVYTINFSVDLDEGILYYYLTPDWEATEELYTLLKQQFNLVPLELSKEFSKNFVLEASNKSKKYFQEYLSFQGKLFEESIQGKIKSAEGKVGGTASGIRSFIKDRSSQNPKKILNSSGEYRLHNSKYFDSFIKPLNTPVDFIISPSTIVYNVYNRIFTEPELNPFYNLQLFAIELNLQNHYRDNNQTYATILKEERQEEFKRMVMSELMSDAAAAKAKREKKLAASLTEEEINTIKKRVERDPSILREYIQENDLVNKYKDKKEEEISIKSAKQYSKNERQFLRLLDLYKSGMVASNQFTFMLSSILKDNYQVGTYANINYPLVSRISIIDHFDEFIKMDKKTQTSGMKNTLRSFSKHTQLGQEFRDVGNEISAQFNKDIQEITTIDDALSYIKEQVKLLQQKADEVYFNNEKLTTNVKQKNRYHLKKIHEAKIAFKITSGQKSETLED